MSLENESAIIDQAKQGDQHAITKLVDAYAPIIFRFAFNVCRNRDKAEHTTQETFISILRKLHQFDSRSKFSTWLYSIVSNHCLMLARSSRSNRFVSIDDGEYTGVEVLAGHSSDDPFKQAEANDIRRHLDAAIQKLTADYRIVFILRDVEGLSTEEVGKITNLSVPAVKSRLHRARQFLRNELAPLFEVQ